MKGRHLEKRGGQVFILKCFTSLRRFCWLQVNFSQATAYPAVRQVGAIVFQKAVAGQLPQMAPICTLRAWLAVQASPLCFAPIVRRSGADQIPEIPIQITEDRHDAVRLHQGPAEKDHAR